MPGIAAEPPGAMSHLPPLSTGTVRRIAAGETIKPVVLQLIGTVAPSLTDVCSLGDGCQISLILPCITRQAEGFCDLSQALKTFKLARARRANPGIALHSAMASCG